MFGKVFRSLWEGSLCGKPDDQLVFVFMLASADADGVVDVVPSIIAHQTGLELDRVQGAIYRLMEPDPESRTTDHEGRRLLAVGERSWGWMIVNYKKYRAMRDDRERREQNNRAQEKRRRQPLSAAVSQGQPQSAQVEVEVDGEVEAEESTDMATGVAVGGVLNLTKRQRPVKRKTPEDVEWERTFHEWFWPAYWRKASKTDALKAWMGIAPKTQDMVESINEGLQRHKSVILSRDKDKQPHASTWLNQRRWEDQDA